MKAAVIYATKYGSTQEIAQGIGAGLGEEAEVLSVQETREIADYELLVLGSPLYAGRLLPEMIDFLEQEQEKLLTKKIAIFLVCGDPGSVLVQGIDAGGQAYLQEIADFLGGKILAREAFLGRMSKEQLAEDDQALLADFSNILGVQFPDFDGLDLVKAREFGKKAKESWVKAR